MATTNTMNGGPAALRLSSDRIVTAASAGRVDAGTLATAAAFRTTAARTLAPAPRDPRAHVRAAHTEARPDLARLTRHAADHEVVPVMTAELFHRLTRVRPRRGGSGRLLEARLEAARGRSGDPSVVYVNLYGVFFTPESAEREVLDLERGLIGERRAETAR